MSPPLHSERVLSTLNEDGSRFLIRPKLAVGRFLTGRRIVAYLLIALFILLPRLRMGGRPAFLIDLVSREVDILGAVFRPSDGLVLMLLGLAIAFTVFLVTALFGRVWCGWGCPHSVYLEHLFRPIERLLEGSPSQQKKLDAQPGFWKPRRMIKWVIFAAVSFALANIFLAYFVGTDRLEQWVFESPLQHPGGFALVCGVSLLVLFDFGYFREQMCIVACPYGRLQSVLLDRQSLIVGYDEKRGEPRTHLKVVGGGGDCVDCGACVTTCPTGIDIRSGLQMECIGCAQCIDACDRVMDKLERKRGLIRYTSKDELAGVPRKLLRVRTVLYPALILVSASLFTWSIVRRSGVELWVDRITGPSFVELPDGKISAQTRIKIENEADQPKLFTITVVEPDAGLRSQASWTIPPRESRALPLYVDVDRKTFSNGERTIHMRIDDDHGFEEILAVTLLGPTR